MRDWDAAISRLFDHDRGKQPANDLVRKWVVSNMLIVECVLVLGNHSSWS